ncbi:MAG: DUF58 domain-containing protein [Gemmatales bacterium]
MSANLLLLFLVFLDWLITPGPGNIVIERQVAERLSLLNQHPVKIVIRNHSRANLTLHWRDTVPLSFELEAATMSDGSGMAEGGSSLLGHYTVKPLKRGQYFFQDVHVRYRSLLGFWERAVISPLKAEVRVYPSVVDVRRYHLLARANRLDLLGLRQLRIKGTAEFESLREYKRGDDVRLLDWKATARRSKLIVRNQQAERNQTILVLLDSGRLMNAEEKNVSKLDLAINATLLLTHVALSRGDRIGLCAFSHRAHTWVAPAPRCISCS